MREKKLQLAVRQATRENNFYLDNVNKGKMIKEMEERKKGKRKATDVCADVRVHGFKMAFLVTL